MNKEKNNQALRAADDGLTACKEFNSAIIEKMLNAYSLHKVILDDDGKPCDYEFIDINPAFEDFTGLKKADVIGKSYKKLIPESEIETTDWVDIYGKVATTGIPITFESYTKAFEKWVVVNAYSPKKGYFVTVFTDVSNIKRSEKELAEKNEELTSLYEELTASEEELRQQFEDLSYHQEKLRISEERFRLAAEGSSGIIFDQDLLKNRYYISDRWIDLLGYEKAEFDNEGNGNLLNKWNEMLHPDDRKEAKKSAIGHLKGKTPFFSCELRLKCKNGEYLWFLARGKALLDKDQKAVRFAGSFTYIDDRKKYEMRLQESYQELEATYEELFATQEELEKQYTELKAFQEKLHYNAYHDSLTGLHNRLSLYENLEICIKDYPNDRTALLFIDSDNFKLINDTLGHSFGDKLIASIGKRLSSLFGDAQMLYRLGGDEFIVCCNFVSLDEVKKSAAKIIQSFNAPFKIDNSMLHSTVSIGISIYPEDGENVDELMRSADIAMYNAKSKGKNKYVFYSHDMQDMIRERMIIEKYLRNAIQNNEFLLYYQPQLDIKTGKISGFEALLRWNNSELGLVPPLKFISIAEETHQIIPIGEWVLETACLFLKHLHSEGYANISMSVNVSILQLLQNDFADTVLKIIKDVGIHPEHLELEITESVLMESFEAICENLLSLKNNGVKIALDDFGRGYSSLSYLKQLPINTLKIDKSFIDSIHSDKSSENITGTIVSIGRKMGMTILAEGVEKQEQLQYLTKHKCHKIQGFLISKPVPPDEAIKLFHEPQYHSII